MPAKRDVAAFEMRAASYEQGWLGRLHHEIADRTADLALLTLPAPSRVLDIGCGTGYLLRTLADRCSSAKQFDGIDPAPSMIQVATSSSRDGRLQFAAGIAEHLLFPDDAFDLVVTTTSFDHWSDQQAGLRECARVLQPGGQLVLVDQFSLWLAPTLLVGRRGKARTKQAATKLLHAAGFRSVTWHDLYTVIIRAGTATI
jgi:ubiquinone/menaquinone biosynthesis C-methylase UbiE